MTKYVGNNIGEKSIAGPFGNWWCLSCWCLGGLLIVFRWPWCLSVLTVSGDVSGTLLMCLGVLWCLVSVPVVSW